MNTFRKLLGGNPQTVTDPQQAFGLCGAFIEEGESALVYPSMLYITSKPDGKFGVWIDRDDHLFDTVEEAEEYLVLEWAIPMGYVRSVVKDTPTLIQDLYDALYALWNGEPELLIENGITDEVYTNIENLAKNGQ